jgi:hypothetical protein
MRASTTVWLILGIVAGSTSLHAWTLQACSSQGPDAQSRAAYRRALEAAAPGTALYTPHLFPKSEADVIEDFVYYHRNAFSDMPPAAMPTPDRHFFELLDAGKIRFEVFQVENWDLLRCGPRKERAFYHIVRAFDRTTGDELLRASVEDNGHVSRVRHRPLEAPLRPIASLAQVTASARSRFGLQPSNAQYVAAWGTVRCDEVDPCVAFKQGAEVFLATPAAEAVYRLEAASSRLSLHGDLAPSQKEARLESLRQQGRSLVSLGFDTFTTATRVEPPKP